MLPIEEHLTADPPMVLAPLQPILHRAGELQRHDLERFEIPVPVLRHERTDGPEGGMSVESEAEQRFHLVQEVAPAAPVITVDPRDDLRPGAWSRGEIGLHLGAQNGLAHSVGVEELGVVPVKRGAALPVEGLGVRSTVIPVGSS